MTSRKTAAYGVGAALLVTYFAAANMPSPDPPPARERAQPAPATDTLAVEVRAQAARLRARMAEAPTPQAHPRNPFAFGAVPVAQASASAIVHAAVAEDAPAPAVDPPPALTLMGIAEESSPAGPRRTAVIGGPGDEIYMVIEGQAIGTRYKVTRIGADAVELEDLVSKAYRRIALR